ncbi:MAG: hypothetical protein Q9170_005363 [Blastenia crenularia]
MQRNALQEDLEGSISQLAAYRVPQSDTRALAALPHADVDLRVLGSLHYQCLWLDTGALTAPHSPSPGLD